MFCKCFILYVTTFYLQHVFYMLKQLQKCFATFLQMFYFTLALITRPPDGVLLAAAPLAARRLWRLALLIAPEFDGVS